MEHRAPHPDDPFAPDALQRAVPRYTSYPTAPHFSASVGAAAYRRALEALDPATTVSLYAHIPFCDRLCWFCACRTQGTRRRAPVTAYLADLEAEIAALGRAVPEGVSVRHMHWGGGSPTILSSDEMRSLRAAFDAAFPNNDGAEIAVEIDPRDVTEDRLDGLAAIGLTRASIGVQDFDPGVQAAIGRRQGHDLTRAVVDGLRGIGITGLNIDLLYGLPGQTVASLSRTIEQVLELAPDRIALFGYAHVPWMARRQTMIDADTLPDSAARVVQAATARAVLLGAGYVPVGIDHFARPGDALAAAARNGTVRRNFQGYTTDTAGALIAAGASAIGELPAGYFQNDPATASYRQTIAEGRFATTRGHLFTLDDRVRKAAIESLLCRFEIDFAALSARFGDFAAPLRDRMAEIAAMAPPGALEPLGDGWRVLPEARDRVRLIAAELDAFFGHAQARHSLAV